MFRIKSVKQVFYFQIERGLFIGIIIQIQIHDRIFVWREAFHLAMFFIVEMICLAIDAYKKEIPTSILISFYASKLMPHKL